VTKSAIEVSVIYLDASAIVKLILEEPESAALVGSLHSEDRHVTSRVAMVEVMRAATRHGGVPSERLHAVLDALDMIELTEEVASRAGSIGPGDLRALDAIHLASAIGIRRELAAFVVYDERIGAAARVLGLPVAAPA
jgi:predicted nucleic acid-binding protein